MAVVKHDGGTWTDRDRDDGQLDLLKAERAMRLAGRGRQGTLSADLAAGVAGAARQVHMPRGDRRNYRRSASLGRAHIKQ